MNVIRRFALPAIVACLIVLLMPQSSSALVPYYINRNPQPFYDMVPGDSFQTDIRVYSTSDEPQSDFYARYLIGNSVFSSAVATSEPSEQIPVSIVVSFNSDVMNACVDGMISPILQVVSVLPDGEEQIAWQEEGWTPGCSVADGSPTIVSVSTPIWSAICGANNDSIAFADQPAGVILVSDSGWADGSRLIAFGASENYYLEGDTEFHYTDTADPCITDSPIKATVTAICGENNDEVDIPTQPAGVLVDDTNWIDNSRTITFSADAGYVLPENALTQQIEEDHFLPCGVSPLPPSEPTAACGPNNDIITVPVQPEGVLVEDTGWIENERTVTVNPAAGYTFVENGPIRFSSTDDNVPCENEPVSTTLVLQFSSSDGGSMEGTDVSLNTASVAQTESTSYAQGTIDESNQLVFAELPAGIYHVVSNPAGYQPVNTALEISGEESTVTLEIPVTAIQVVTPEPTPSEPVEPTTTPVQPTEVATASNGVVTSLPSTGSGPNGYAIDAMLTIIVAGIGLLAVCVRNYGSHLTQE